MKNSVTSYHSPSNTHWVKLCLHLLAALLLVLAPIFLARGQSPDGATTLSSVSIHQVSNGTLVQITADNSLNRAQTFQDRDGFHIVVPDAGISDLVRASKGVRVKRIGTAIEILVQARQGAPVTVQNLDNRINITVDGKLDNNPTETTSVTESAQSQQTSPSTSASGYSLPTDYAASQNYGSSYPAERSSAAPAPAPAQPQAATPADQGVVRDPGEYRSKDEGNVTDIPPAEEGVFASAFSGTSVAIGFFLAVVGLLVVWKFRPKSSPTTEVVDEVEANEQAQALDSVELMDDSSKPKDSSIALVRNTRAVPANSTPRPVPVVRQVATAPASLYGAYRIDQEVGKLVVGQAHRMDVLSSRASEDRRAIQASLIKTIASECSDDERRRAREALEEYGFVARESAALLLATDAFERTSAARTLGEVGSAAALPFLLEALYDVESIVRNQAVVSIGELKVPSAIGALLDMARKHPDVPSRIVSKALSACSVEGLGFFDAILPATSFLTTGSESVGFDFMPIEAGSTVEELPETIEEEGLAEALVQVLSESVEQRSEAVENLAQYLSRSSVSALVSCSHQDPESTIRALAVSSLAFIDHESVFPAVLMGMADESREVRAAAARALSRLNFDRSEAYVHLIQTADAQILSNVAQACIKAGIVSQNLDRLSSGDRRQAYEAFALVSLLAKANIIAPILEAIEHHRDKTVRVSAVSLLASTGEAYVFDHLQKLASNDELDEEVKTAVLEGMYKLEQSRPKDEAAVDEFVIREHQEEEFERFEKKENADQIEAAFHLNARTEVDEFEP